MKANAIVLCCTPSYIPYALTTLVSCRDHGGSAVADFHLVVPDASALDEDRALGFARDRGFELVFHSVTINPLAHEMVHNGLGIGTLARLFLNEWISPDYEKVLYLDSDILAVRPFAQVFDTDLRGLLLAAVEDLMSFRFAGGKRPGQALFDGLGLKPAAPYFNAGVLLLNWPVVLKGMWLQRAVSCGIDFKKRGVMQRFGDQDILNSTFAEHWLPLPVQFNVMNQFAYHFPNKPVFRHFAGPCKPWQDMLSPYSLGFGGVYRSVLRGTAWKAPRMLRWRKDTEYSFREYLWFRFGPKLRRALAGQVVTD